MNTNRVSAAIVALGLLAHAGPSFATPTPTPTPTETARAEGRTRFQRGIELYKEGNFYAALAEFRAANRVAPAARIQYNLGQTLFQLQDYAGALAAFEAYLADGKEQLTEERVREVEADIAKLRPRVATLKIATNLDLANRSALYIAVDDEHRTLEHGSVRVASGRRKLAVTAPGYQTETRVLDLAGNSLVEVTIELKPIAIAVPSSTATSTSRPDTAAATRPQSSRTLPLYVSLGTTAALGTTTLALALLANGKLKNWETASGRPDADGNELERLRSSTKTMALLADAFGGATVIAGVTSLVLLVLNVSRDAYAETKATATRMPALGLCDLRPMVGADRLGISGRF